jgi:molybdopterin/thiamine biosynthesis adenylyltransferase
MVRSAYKLLATEQHPTAPRPVLSAHRESVGQRLLSRRERLVLTDDLTSKLSELSAGTLARCEAVRVAHQTTRTNFVIGLHVGETDVTVVDVPGGLSAPDVLAGWPITGLAYRANVWTGHRHLETVADLMHVLGAAGFDVESLNGLASALGGTTLILFVGAAPDTYVAYAVAADDPTVLKEVGIVHSADSASRLPDDASTLAATRAAVVGLGSLGSKIAVSLARSGVRRFLLVDDDVLLGENIVRHDLDWAAVGVHKAAAVADKLRRIAPGIDAVARIQNIDGQQSPVGAETILKDLATCDLIIDATANPHVFLRLAGLARMSKTAMVWAQVYAGGLGGVIARARPGLDPNPYAMRDGLIDHTTRLPEAPFQTAAGYDDTGDVPWVAYDSDVSYIAAAATHLALDTALKRDPSAFPSSAYRLALRQGWDFSGPFEAQPIGIEGPGWDFDISEHDEADVREAVAVVTALLKGDHSDSHPAAA